MAVPAGRHPPDEQGSQAQGVDGSIVDGLSKPRRYWAIAAIQTTITLATLDGSIANIALPVIARDVHVSPSAVTWVVNAYQLVMVVALLPMSALGERLGFRRVFLCGISLFTLGSLACAVAPTLGLLIAARMVQGLGAAAAVGLTAALVRHIYPWEMLGRAIGLNALTVATSTALAPVVATAILSVASWPWLFAVNIPIGLATLGLGLRNLPPVPGRAASFDLAGALLSAAAFGLLFTGMAALAVAPLRAGVELMVALLAFAALLRWQAGEASPMFPLDLLRIPAIAFSASAGVLCFAAQMIAFVSLPFYFGAVMRHSQIEIGALMTPWPVATGIFAPVSGRLSDRVPPAILTALGATILAAGLVFIRLLPVDATMTMIGSGMLACGIGFGFFQPPNNRALIGAAPPTRVGASGGLLSTARLCGQTFGVTTIALCFHDSVQVGSGRALLIGATMALVAAGISTLRGRVG
jgi:MFS transporter, DHA2 family, multidrug resistance protein